VEVQQSHLPALAAAPFRHIKIGQFFPLRDYTFYQRRRKLSTAQRSGRSGALYGRGVNAGLEHNLKHV